MASCLAFTRQHSKTDGAHFCSLNLSSLLPSLIALATRHSQQKRWLGRLSTVYAALCQLAAFVLFLYSTEDVIGKKRGQLTEGHTYIHTYIHIYIYRYI